MKKKTFGWGEASNTRQRHLVSKAKIRKQRALLRRRYQVRVQAELDRIQILFSASHNVPRPRERDRVPFLVPKILSLKNNFGGTVELINDIRRAALMLNHKVFLDFSELEELEASACLLLVSEIFRCNNLRPARNGFRVNGNYPHNKVAFLLLREMGFYRLLKVDEINSLGDDELSKDRPIFLQFRSMAKVNARFAANFCALVSRGVFDIGDANRRRMVAALKEAMGNAHEHAYVSASEFPVLRHRWYVAAHLDPAKCEMMVLILDQGIGIPKRLDAKTYDTINAALRWRLTPSVNGLVPSDGHMIAAATELHRTSTNRRGRGKGFRDMKRLINECDDGELHVRSNRGSYTFKKNSETIQDHHVSISGTLIEWRIRHGIAGNTQTG